MHKKASAIRDQCRQMKSRTRRRTSTNEAGPQIGKNAMDDLIAAASASTGFLAKTGSAYLRALIALDNDTADG
jgi:hypothetical protein